jgi:hypothetical protein
MIRQEGSARVHIRNATPLVRFPCYYGTDTPTCEELAQQTRHRYSPFQRWADHLITGTRFVYPPLASFTDICTAFFSENTLTEKDNGMDLLKSLISLRRSDAWIDCSRCIQESSPNSFQDRSFQALQIRRGQSACRLHDGVGLQAGSGPMTGSFRPRQDLVAMM